MFRIAFNYEKWHNVRLTERFDDSLKVVIIQLWCWHCSDTSNPVSYGIRKEKIKTKNNYILNFFSTTMAYLHIYMLIMTETDSKPTFDNTEMIREGYISRRCRFESPTGSSRKNVDTNLNSFPWCQTLVVS